MKRVLIISVLSLTAVSCSDKKEPESTPLESAHQPFASETIIKSVSDENHTESRYKYESRTGTSGNYEYNYDVSGADYDGNDVSGNIDMKGKYGFGTITDADGNDRDVDVKWVSFGELEATDDDGNTYSLQAD